MDLAMVAMASLLPKLAELLKEYKLQASIRKDIECLSLEMDSMQVVLRKVAEVPRDQLDETVKLWAEQVRKLSYDMEVVVDKLLVRAPNWEGCKGLKKRMGNLFEKGKTRHQIFTSAIKDIKAQVQILADRCDRLSFCDIVANTAGMMTRDAHLASLYSSAEDLVGIHGKKDQELMKLLSDGDKVTNKKLKIVCVVGLGGVGKTTLVKTVYEKIKGDFDCKSFIIAGGNCDAKTVFRYLITDLTMYESHLNTLDEGQLIEKLREILENKRYLIVVDDIWDGNLWESIKYAFANENNIGSRIITTTRILSVSRACCSSSNDLIYQMEPLCDDDSRELLYEKVFPPGSGCPQELEQLSSDILKKCGGVPLVILTIASILACGPWMDPKDEWHALLKSIGSGLIMEYRCWKNMQRILSFSYYDLPPRLKTCLLYLSTFPVSRTIERDRLVKKWIAEGIVTEETKLTESSSKEEAKLSQEISPEEAANRHLDELVNRNVIQHLKSSINCEVLTYHIHPMMHYVLKAIAVEEKFAASLEDKDIASPQRGNFPHFSVDCLNSENPIDASSMAFVGGVRSLTIFGYASRFLLRLFAGVRVLDLEGCQGIERVDLEYICSMVLLKQLCLAKTQITELPPQIANLQYLEGLDVGGTQITDLPSQIGKLQRLKTLDARKSRVKEIPDQVLRLAGLVQLLIGDNESSEGVELPHGIGKMTSLQQLCTVDLRKCSASCLKELGELPCLKEIAVVSSAEPEDTRMNNALLSFLEKSTELRSLKVYSDFRLSTLQLSSSYKYLNCRKKLTVEKSLKAPVVLSDQRFLRMLDIRVCILEKDDLKILGELPMLHGLILRLEVLPRKMVSISCDGFAKLESFYIDCRMPRVIFEDGAMPKLGHLELKLYAGSAREKHMGIKHLLNLQEVSLRYSKWYATNRGVKETTDAVKTEAKEHQNKITLCIAEENKDGTCTMKTEIFEENKEVGCSRITETEEEEGEHADGTGYFLNTNDTQEGDNLHESSSAIASCSGTKEIEEVVE